MLPPPSYMSRFPSTDTISLSGSTDGAESTKTNPMRSATGEPFEADYLIFWSLLSIVSWLLIGVMSYNSSVNPQSEGGMIGLSVLFLVITIFSTTVVCNIAPQGWVGNGIHVLASVVVVWGFTIAFMILTPGWGSSFCLPMFVLPGVTYGGILLEAFTGMFCKLSLLLQRSPREENHALSTMV